MMPVITVTAPALASVDDELRVLGTIAVEVAAALQLRAEDVQVSCVHAATGVLGTRAVAPWPVVVLHGRARPAALMSEALVSARTAVARAWSRPSDEVWAQWLVTS